MLTYSKRKNLFEKGEREWRLEDKALVARDTKGAEQRYPFDQVKSVRLSFTPTNNTPFRHVTIIGMKDGRKVEFDNVHFAGVATFEDRSATYTPFARETVERIAKYSPTAEAHQGAPMGGYIGLIVLMVLVFAVLGLALLIVPVGDWSGIVWVKIGILLLFLPMLWQWVRKARPRGMKLTDIPADALPPG